MTAKPELARTPRDIALVTCAQTSIERQIADFLAGDNDGAALLHALYDDIAEEPLPLPLVETLKRWRSC